MVVRSVLPEHVAGPALEPRMRDLLPGRIEVEAGGGGTILAYRGERGRRGIGRQGRLAPRR